MDGLKNARGIQSRRRKRFWRGRSYCAPFGAVGVTMSDNPKPSHQTTRSGDALRAAGITPVSPWEFLARRMQGVKVTPDIARELSAQTGVSEQFWINMQEAFDRA